MAAHPGVYRRRHHIFQDPRRALKSCRVWPTAYQKGRNDIEFKKRNYLIWCNQLLRTRDTANAFTHRHQGHRHCMRLNVLYYYVRTAVVSVAMQCSMTTRSDFFSNGGPPQWITGERQANHVLVWRQRATEGRRFEWKTNNSAGSGPIKT